MHFFFIFCNYPAGVIQNLIGLYYSFYFFLVCGGVAAGVLFKNAGKMALVGKTGEVGNFGKGVVGSLHQVNRLFNSLLAQIVAERKVVKVFGKLTRQVGRVNVQFLRQFF